MDDDALPEADWAEALKGTVPTRLTFDCYMTETATGDFVLVSVDNPTIKLLAFHLAESMSVEGAAILAGKVRERFPGCFDDDPPSGGGRRLPGSKAA